MRCDILWIHCWHDANRISYRRSVAAVSPNNTEHVRLHLFCVLQRRSKFGLTFFSTLPPPTEKTITASFSFRRLPRSHSTKTEAQPSSFVRAVTQKRYRSERNIPDPRSCENRSLRVTHSPHYRLLPGKRAGHRAHERPTAGSTIFSRTGRIDLLRDFYRLSEMLFTIGHNCV